jgi:hypothetical protein
VNRLRWLLGFIHRVAYATLISFVVWFLWTARFDTLPLGRDLQLGIVKVLDFPVAMLSERMPLTGWLSIDPFTRDQMGHNEPNEKVLLWHLRTAVPVYVVLFYLPNLVMWIVRRFGNGRGSKEAHAATTAIEQT